MNTKVTLNTSSSVPVKAYNTSTYERVTARMYTKSALIEPLILNNDGKIGHKTSKIVPSRHFETIPAPTSLFSAKIVPNRLNNLNNPPGPRIAPPASIVPPAISMPIAVLLAVTAFGTDIARLRSCNFHAVMGYQGLRGVGTVIARGDLGTVPAILRPVEGGDGSE